MSRKKSTVSLAMSDKSMFFLYLHLKEYEWVVGTYHRVKKAEKVYLVEIYTGDDNWFLRMGNTSMDKAFEFFYTNRNSTSQSYRPHGIKNNELTGINKILLLALEDYPPIVDALIDVLQGV